MPAPVHREADTMKKHLMVLLFLSVTISALPVDSRAGTDLHRQPDVRHFDQETGMSSPYVTGVAVDSLGDIWVGTRDGVLRYDGAAWYRRELPVRTVHCVRRVRPHGVVIGTDNGAYSFQRRQSGAIDTTAWAPYRYPRPRTPADTLYKNVYAVGTGAGADAVWFGTQTGAKRYTTFRLFSVDTTHGLPTDTVTAIAEERDGLVWIGTPKGLYASNGERMLSSDDVPGHSVPDALQSARITALEWDSLERTLWVGTANGLFLRNQSGWWSVTELGTRRIYCIRSDGNGTVYVGAGFHLYVRVPPHRSDTIWMQFDSPYQVRSVDLAADGVIWIGTYGGGLYRWQPGESGEIRLAHPVKRMERLPDGGALLVSDADVHVLSPQGRLERMLSHVPWEKVYTSLALRDGAVWIGTDTGAYRVKNGRITMSLGRTSLLEGSPVRSLMLDARGFLWIGSERAIYWLHLQTNMLRLWQETGDRVVFPLAQTPDSTVWFGTDTGVYGVSHIYDSARRRFHPIYRAGSDILGAVRTAIVDRSGTFWFADENGLVVQVTASEDTTAPWTATVAGTDAGIRGSRIRSFSTGADSSLWLATDGGVNRYRNGLWAYYGMTEGLRNRNTWCTLALGNEAFLVGTERGFEVLQITSGAPDTWIEPFPSEVESGAIPPVLVGGADRWQRTPAHRLRYSWRLDDGTWSQPDQHTRIALSGIPPGDHTLEVRALDGDLNWDPAPAKTQFTITGQGSPGLITVFVLLIGILVYVIWKWQRAERLLRNREQTGS